MSNTRIVFMYLCVFIDKKIHRYNILDMREILRADQILGGPGKLLGGFWEASWEASGGSGWLWYTFCCCFKSKLLPSVVLPLKRLAGQGGQGDRETEREWGRVNPHESMSERACLYIKGANKYNFKMLFRPCALAF